MRYAQLDEQNIVVGISPAEVQGFVEIPDHVGFGWQSGDDGSWSLPVEGRKTEIARLCDEANRECGRRISEAYGSANRSAEMLYRLNNLGSLKEQDTERKRLVARCTALKTTIKALPDNDFAGFDVADDNHWSAS